MSLEHLMTTFAGRPVRRLTAPQPATAAGVAWRLTLGPEEEQAFRRREGLPPEGPDAPPYAEQLLAPLLTWNRADQVEALVISCWASAHQLWELSSEATARALCDAAPRLASLEALFLGDLPRFMSDLAYIQQSDLGALLSTLHPLRCFGARGGSGLRLINLRHDSLEELTLQSSGLERACLHDLAAAHLPNLRHLDLWLGTEEYGLDATADDLVSLFSGKLFPSLTHLGLMNTDIADELAVALSTSPLLDQLESLDLSLGTISDNGLKPLLQHPALRRLKRLNLTGHFLGSDLCKRLPALLPDTALTLQTSNSAYLLPQERYITHGE